MTDNQQTTGLTKWNDQKGVTTVEYAVMLMLVAIAVATATPNIASAVKDVFTSTINVL